MNTAWVPDLGWTLIHFLWQGAAIAGIYAVARIFAAKPRALSHRLRSPRADGCGSRCNIHHTDSAAGSPPNHHIAPAVRSKWSTAPVAPSASLPETAMRWIVTLFLHGAGLLSLRLFLESIFASRLKSAPVWPVPQEWHERLHQLGLESAFPAELVF